jgi:hypothetical protein
MSQPSVPFPKPGQEADQPAISHSAEEWLTASEAAAHLKVKPRTIPLRA